MATRKVTINELSDLIKKMIKEDFENEISASNKTNEGYPSTPINIKDSLENILHSYAAAEILETIADFYNKDAFGEKLDTQDEISDIIYKCINMIRNNVHNKILSKMNAGG